MNGSLNLVHFRDRRYEEVPINKIKVINSRQRDNEQFVMNVTSIGEVGLQKPIRVNDKFLERDGFYELVCGEGRLLAHTKLNKQKIMAEVVTCTRSEAYVESLIENIARTNPVSMNFARELKRLHDENWELCEIARFACRTKGYVRELIHLVEQGEDRLIHGVEQGIFPMSFAIQVASTEDSQLQNLLMDSFDAGLVTTSNFAQARKIISARAKSVRPKKATKEYTVHQLRRDILDATKAKTSYVKEAQTKENRFLMLLGGINELWKDHKFQELLRQERLDRRPELAGDFGYETKPIGGQFDDK